MSENTAISWTDSTWSPWEGCTKVSPGCDNCYAEGMNKWLRKGENWGPGAPRRIYSEDHWAKPIKWQRDAPKFHTLHNRNRRVFPSVCDPFDNEAPGLQLERLWATIRLTPGLTWLLLTKRIGNAKTMLPADWGDGYPNVWLGATVINQDEADRDIPKLLAVPARVRFLSIEPMLGPIDLRRHLWTCCGNLIEGYGGDGFMTPPDPPTCCEAPDPSDALAWVIAGGESGPHARPAHPDWFRSLRDQCAAAGVPFHFKQWGEFTEQDDGLGKTFLVQEGDPDYETEAAKCAAFISLDGLVIGSMNDSRGGVRYRGMLRPGKKATGRLLDGVEHNGFPA